MCLFQVIGGQWANLTQLHGKFVIYIGFQIIKKAKYKCSCISYRQTLLGSEIRITHDVESPNVVNPNPCGTSGLYVELPDKFFKVPRGGLYGAIGKMHKIIFSLDNDF